MRPIRSDIPPVILKDPQFGLSTRTCKRELSTAREEKIDVAQVIPTNRPASSIKSDTLGHVIGPWGWTADDEMLTLEEDEESFVAVWQEKQGLWQVFWDVDAEELDAPEEEVQEIRLRRRPLLRYSSKLVTKDHTK